MNAKKRPAAHKKASSTSIAIVISGALCFHWKMESKRPTHRDIAQIAGVTHVTVSLALRGHRSIPKETRDRIKKIAEEIGYRRDPALQSLMLYRRGAKPSGYQATLAWINNFTTDPNLLKKRFPHYWRGAQDRCTELGYRLEEFRMIDLNYNFNRLSKILHARNIEGLLFPPQDGMKEIAAKFDWENFVSVAFGFSLVNPQLDIVTNAMFSSTRVAVRELRAMGYRRIGFLIEDIFDENTDGNFTAGFNIEQYRFAPSERVPIHHIPRSSPASECEQSFRKWFFSHSPEVLLIATKGIDWLLSFSPAERGGCGYAIMDVPSDNNETSGIDQNNYTIGRSAVDMLITKIHANDLGIPPVRRRIMVEGCWRPGKTAPRAPENNGTQRDVGSVLEKSGKVEILSP